MKIPAPPTLFPRLRLQAHIQNLIREQGVDQAWEIIADVIAREVTKYSYAPEAAEETDLAKPGTGIRTRTPRT
jgi:hypothetical protein